MPLVSLRSLSVPVAALALLSACSSSDGEASSPTPSTSTTSSTSSSGTAASGIDCSKAGDLTGTPEKPLPSDLPLPAGATTYLSKGPFGTTSLWFAAADGDGTNLDATRDAAVEVMLKAGYKLTRKDQEEGSEAEAVLTGPHATAIQVIQLCQGKNRIKYTVTS